MKTLNLYEKQKVILENKDKPKIDNCDDVIIKVKVAGICGSDISRFGKIGSYNPGLTWGHEFSGIVHEVGQSVSHFKKGDRVIACNCFPCYKCDFCKKSQFSRCIDLKVLGGQINGAFAEYIKIPELNVLKIPQNLDFESASLIEPSSVVVHGFNKINIKAGQSVAIVGCGTIGLLAVQWAKIFGALEVYAFDSDPYKLEVAKKTGADFTFNISNGDYFKKYMELTGNNGVDVVVESSGNASGIVNTFLLSKKGGSLLLLGIPYGDVNFPRNNFEKIIRNELTVIGSWNSMSAPFPGNEWRTSIKYLEKKLLNISPLITHRTTLEEVPDLLTKLYNREISFIKVIIQINEKLID